MSGIVLSMYRGDDRQFNLAFTKNGSPYNLTGGSMWITAKLKVSDADSAAQFQKKIGSGITIVSAVDGTATLTVSASDTDDMSDEQTELFCDVQIKDSTGNIVTPTAFKLIVNPEITRDTS